jgi:cytochrome b pre-mRNA-processing protein 3
MTISSSSTTVRKECRLAPTYQNWFQIANLHVWLVRTRYRALPTTHGRTYDQELINHFFLDVEDRMRAALAHKAPERIVKGYMKEMRDQWAGATFAFDLGLVGSDAELSGALWRNVFASRGLLEARGEVIGKPGKSSGPRAVDSSDNDNVAANNPNEVEESSSSFTGNKLSDSALADLPFHLYVFTAYVRREIKRLESLSDEQVLAGYIDPFGSMESHALAAERDFAMEKEERKLLGLDEDIPSRTPIPKAKRRTASA